MNILGISGRKQSGKTTTANYITGRVMKSLGLVKDFHLDTKNGGVLVINTSDANGQDGWGVFDIARKDSDFAEYAERELWPYVKPYSFADGLKNLCIEFFGLKPEQVYGTDKQKNTPTKVKWEDTPTWKNTSLNLNRGYMTAREFMQFFGTDIMRKMHEPVHVNHAINQILAEKPRLAIIPDVRFPNEVKAIQDAGGKVLRMTRSHHEDSHDSECALDVGQFDWGNFDFILENDAQETDLEAMLEQFYNINLVR